jgi:hypothetical protein
MRPRSRYAIAAIALAAAALALLAVRRATRVPRLEPLVTASGRPLTPLCAATVQAHCNKRVECGQMDRRELASCIDDLGAGCERSLGWKLRAGVLAAGGEAEEECVEAMAAAGCNALQALLGEDELQLFEITDRCEMAELLKPRSGLGQPCAESSDCTSGFCPGLAPTCHRCTPFAALQQACSPGLIECDPKSATCAPAPGGGFVCAPLVRGTAAGKRAKTGEACADEPGACAESEARCVAGKCLLRPFILREGAECGDFTDCRDSLYCKGAVGGAAKGRCTPQSAVGGPCEALDFGACAADAACNNGRCRRLRSAGERCAGPYQCKAFLACVPLSMEKGFLGGATCLPNPTVGQPCNRHQPCVASFCDAASSRCLPLAPGGAACRVSQQCDSGWCAPAGVCYAPCASG